MFSNVQNLNPQLYTATSCQGDMSQSSREEAQLSAKILTPSLSTSGRFALMKKRRERRNARGVPGSRRLGSGGLGFTGIPLQAFAGQPNQS